MGALLVLFLHIFCTLSQICQSLIALTECAGTLLHSGLLEPVFENYFGVFVIG